MSFVTRARSRMGRCGAALTSTGKRVLGRDLAQPGRQRSARTKNCDRTRRIPRRSQAEEQLGIGEAGERAGDEAAQVVRSRRTSTRTSPSWRALIPARRACRASTRARADRQPPGHAVRQGASPSAPTRARRGMRTSRRAPPTSTRPPPAPRRFAWRRTRRAGQSPGQLALAIVARGAVVERDGCGRGRSTSRCRNELTRADNLGSATKNFLVSSYTSGSARSRRVHEEVLNAQRTDRGGLSGVRAGRN